MTPWVLLGLTGLMSLGLALNSPARRAVTPEIVPREDLTAAISLKNASVNIARALGPTLGGLLMSATGPAVLFFLNAISFLLVIGALYTWQRETTKSRLPAEHFWDALQAGVRYVRHEPVIWAVLARAGTFSLCGSALLALLPLLARHELGQDAVGYGMLLGCFGVGATLGATFMPWRRRHCTSEQLVAGAAIAFAAVLVVVAILRLWGGICAAMILGGMAGGSTLWGAVANATSIRPC